MADLTECPVCLEEFKEPKLLPCNHTFCLECLDNVRKDNGITCPMCNAEHTVPERGVTAFTENQTMVQLISDRKRLQAVEKRLERELENKQANPNQAKNNSEDQEATRQEQVKVKIESGAVPKVKQRGNIEAEAANLLTFSQQKLALLQSEYDPKRCHHCQKVSSPEKLKTCTKCKTAKYCSRECQTKDWSRKHKADCKEIKRLITIVGTETNDNKQENVREQRNLNANLRDEEQEIPNLRPKVKQQDVPSTENRMNEQETPKAGANLLTFSRQKLALIQCEYNPKCCNYCKRVVDQLKTCSKCKTAKYCSHECQTKDWSEKHKAHCKEIRRLGNLIQRESGATATIQIKPSERILKAVPSEKPWFLEDNMVYGRMCICENKLVLCGTMEDVFSSVIDVYNTTTHRKEGSACFIRPGDIVSGLSVVNMGSHRFIGISTENSFEFLKQHRFELWSFPSRKPFYKYTTNPNTYTVIHNFEGTLLVANELEKTIYEFDVTKTPFKFTGLTIPTGFSMLYCVQSICVLKQGGETRLALQYVGGGEDSQIKCIDYRGRELWKMVDPPLDGRPFQPLGICTDGNGRIFASEQDSNRVVVIKEDLSLQTLVVAPGKVWCITWCDVTSRLLVLHSNDRNTRMMISVYHLRGE